MVHLRIVTPADSAEPALQLLFASESVLNVVHLRGVVRKPRGDMILCDVAREDASVIISDLRELQGPEASLRPSRSPPWQGIQPPARI